MLTVHFKVLTVSGVWRPTNLSSKQSKLLYKCYSFVVIILMYSLGFSQLARIILIKQDFVDFNDTFFILLSTNFACFKATSILLNQRQVINLLNMFQVNYCIAQNDFEKTIRKKYDDLCRKIEIVLLSLVEITALFVIIAPLFNGIENRNLPYKVLLPYETSTFRIYWLTYLHHTFGAISFTAISITNDAIITGFMLQTCGQIDLLQHRLKEFPRSVLKIYETNESELSVKSLEKQCMTQIIQHHAHIYNIAKTICTTFSDIIVCQFCISAMEICVSVYQLSVRTTNAVELFTYILYLVCMLGQFFVYCYFGNEVTIQSKKLSTTIFNIDWTPLSLRLKKDLTFMLLRSSKPIAMSCGTLVNLTLESFVIILKTSYSAFTVLKRTA